MSTITIGFRPVPGKEMQHDLAWKHRSIAFTWMRHIQRNPFALRAYNRAFRLWSHAVDRTNLYTETVVYPAPPIPTKESDK